MPNNDKMSRSEAGRKGGQASNGGNNSNSRSESLQGNKNAEGPHKVSPEGRKKMSEGGRKGGER